MTTPRNPSTRPARPLTPMEAARLAVQADAEARLGAFRELHHREPRASEKADLIGDLICFERWGGRVCGWPTLRALSPLSLNTYTLDWDPVAGRYSCSCPASGDCYHLRTLERDLLASLAQERREWLASAAAASTATKARDFDA